MRMTSIVRNRRAAGRRQGERGTALVELTLLLGLILLLAVGVFEFGRGFHTYMSVIQAAREGARAAIDGTRTDAQLESIAATAASPIGVTVAVSHQGARTTVSVTTSFTSAVPFISAAWGGGPLVMSRAFTSE